MTSQGPVACFIYREPISWASRLSGCPASFGSFLVYSLRANARTPGLPVRGVVEVPPTCSLSFRAATTKALAHGAEYQTEKPLRTEPGRLSVVWAELPHHLRRR